jgi:cell wall-associated NlpC family hydrolase
MTMRLRPFLPFVILPAMLALSACQILPTGGRDGGEKSAAASPITGGEIAVTSLDGPDAGEKVQKPAAPPAVPPPPATAGAEPAADAAAKPPAPAAGAESAKDTATADPALEAKPVEPTVVKTAAHLACEKRGGRWSIAGGGTAAFCQTPTKDAGKSCRKSTDCSGYCLEKSRTCAPVTPMLGCHDILNETGRMLTQCIN